MTELQKAFIAAAVLGTGAIIVFLGVRLFIDILRAHRERRLRELIK